MSHAGCLWKIFGIPPSFVSRISNATVLQQAGKKKVSCDIRAAQLKLLGEVLMDPERSLLRKVAFHRQSLILITSAWVRRVGRPKQNWTDQLVQAMQSAAGSLTEWEKIEISPEKLTRVVSSLVLWGNRRSEQPMHCIDLTVNRVSRVESSRVESSRVESSGVESSRVD